MATTIEVVKTALRIPSSVTLYDNELNALIASASAVMEAGGVDMTHEDSAVIDSACIMYVKANFGNRPDSVRCGEAFNAIVKQRALVDWGASNANS